MSFSQIQHTISSNSFINPYRYGYNGFESDDEISGEGNSIDFGNRMYDPRLGRMRSLDAFASKYPSVSPYAFVYNNPISNIEMGGDSVLFYSQSGTYLGYSNDNQRYKDKNLLVIVDDKNLKSFFAEYERKRNLKDVTPEYKEAIIAGLESMGTSIDVTDFVGFFNEYSHKKEINGKDVTLPKDYEEQGVEDQFFVEWSAPIFNKAVNSNDKGGSVAVDESKAYTENSQNSVTLQGSSVYGFSSFHIHSSFYVKPGPSKYPDESRLDLIKGSEWNIVVGNGLFTLYKDSNPETSTYGTTKNIVRIEIYTNEKFTSDKNTPKK